MGRNNRVILKVSIVNSPNKLYPIRAINAVTILNHENISLNSCLSTLAELRKRANGGPLIEMLPVKKPRSIPTSLYDQSDNLSVYLIPKSEKTDNKIKKTLMIVIKISSDIYLSVRTPTRVNKAPKPIND